MAMARGGVAHRVEKTQPSVANFEDAVLPEIEPTGLTRTTFRQRLIEAERRECARAPGRVQLSA